MSRQAKCAKPPCRDVSSAWRFHCYLKSTYYTFCPCTLKAQFVPFYVSLPWVNTSLSDTNLWISPWKSTFMTARRKSGCSLLRKYTAPWYPNGPNLSPAFYYIPHCKTWCKPLKHNDLWLSLCADKKKNPLKPLSFKGFFLVRPAGFEPVAFRVGV